MSFHLNDFWGFKGFDFKDEKFFSPLKTAEAYILSNFVLNEDLYNMNLNLPQNIVKDNINVDVDDEMRTITISYEYHNDYGSSSYQHTETVPEDADLNTIDVLFDSNKLNITIKKA